MMEQLAPPPPETPQEGAKPKSEGKRGRPPGSKNQPRREVVWSPSRRFVQETIKRVLEVVGDRLQGISFVCDGAFGHHDALQRVRQVG